jgi:hypothetical protein
MMGWSPGRVNDYNIAGVMVSVLTLSGVDDGLEPWSSQANDYNKSMK